MNRAKFFGATRVGRRLTVFLHPRVHPGGIKYPLRFQGGQKCWMCKMMFRSLPIPRDAIADQSKITVSEPVYDDEGNITRRGIYMSATVKRQLDELLKGPDGDKLQKAIDEIAEHPEL